MAFCPPPALRPELFLLHGTQSAGPSWVQCYFVVLFLLNRWFSVIAFHQNDLEPLRNADTPIPFQTRSESLGVRARHRERQNSRRFQGAARVRTAAPNLEAVHSRLGALEAITQGGLSSLPPQLLEAESWLEERGCALDVKDVGQSAEATRASLRRLEATRRDLEAFSTRIERLQQTAALLESRQNPERWVGARRTQGGAGRRREGSPFRGTRGRSGLEKKGFSAVSSLPRHQGAGPDAGAEGGPFRAAAEGRRQGARPAGTAAVPPVGTGGPAPRNLAGQQGGHG